MAKLFEIKSRIDYGDEEMVRCVYEHEYTPNKDKTDKSITIKNKNGGVRTITQVGMDKILPNYGVCKTQVISISIFTTDKNKIEDYQKQSDDYFNTYLNNRIILDTKLIKKLNNKWQNKTSVED